MLVLAASGTPDELVADPEEVELADAVGVVEFDEAAVLDDSTAGEDDVVQADVTVPSPRTTAMPAHLNPRPTLHPLTHP